MIRRLAGPRLNSVGDLAAYASPWLSFAAGSGPVPSACRSRALARRAARMTARLRPRRRARGRDGGDAGWASAADRALASRSKRARASDVGRHARGQDLDRDVAAQRFCVVRLAKTLARTASMTGAAISVDRTDRERFHGASVTEVTAFAGRARNRRVFRARATARQRQIEMRRSRAVPATRCFSGPSLSTAKCKRGVLGVRAARVRAHVPDHLASMHVLAFARVGVVVQMRVVVAIHAGPDPGTRQNREAPACACW